MDLAKLQESFATFARQEKPIADDAKAFRFAQIVATGNERMTPADQLDVYREQFFLRHVGSLREDFPTLELLLGRDRFDAMCNAYLAAMPPRSFALRDASDRVAELVATTSPWKDDPLLADCAKVEWAFIEAFDAADAPPLDVSMLASIDEDAWDGAKIVLHPSVKLLALSHPAHTYRTAVRSGESPARPDPKPTFVVAFRAADDTLRWLEVEHAAFTLLEALRNGRALGEAGEEAAKLDADVGEKIGVWFQTWTQNGWISKIEV